MLSRHQSGDDARWDWPSQFLVQALKLERQFFMINAQQTQQSGVEIPYMNRVANDVVAVVVGLPVSDSRIGSASGQPTGVAKRMVIAAIIGFL